MPDTDAAVRSIERFEALYRSEVDRVYSYARARLGSAEADDVVSEVFHAAALAWRSGNEAALAAPWIMTVTKNKVIDRWRQAERRKVRDMLFRQRERDRLVQLDDWTEPGNRDRVVETLDRMSTRHRMLLVLHYVDGMTVPEIALQVEQSVAAVESGLARARRAFRQHWSDEEER
ncbi:MAG: sigma-70 family RNA polymerase sigma factor [Ilumatobacter sp.]|nr:sigma-70 family RNA polymerase sigma factor [Ilumatobacter sp.]